MTPGSPHAFTNTHQVWRLIEKDYTLRLSLIANEWATEHLKAWNAVFAEGRKRGNSGYYGPALVEMEIADADKRAEWSYQACCEIWEIQGRTKCKLFFRAVFDWCLQPMFSTRQSCFTHELELHQKRTGRGFSQGLSVICGHMKREMGRLRAKWNTKFEIATRDNENRERLSVPILQRASQNGNRGRETNNRPSAEHLRDLPEQFAGLKEEEKNEAVPGYDPYLHASGVDGEGIREWTLRRPNRDRSPRFQALAARAIDADILTPTTSEQAWDLLRDDFELRHHLLSYELSEKSRPEFNALYSGRVRSASYYVSARIKFELKKADYTAEKYFDACCEAWESQGRTKCRAFFLAVLHYVLIPSFDDRVTITSNDITSRHPNFPSMSRDLEHFRREIERLRSRWYSKIEIASRNNENQERLKQEREARQFSPMAEARFTNAALLEAGPDVDPKIQAREALLNRIQKASNVATFKYTDASLIFDVSVRTIQTWLDEGKLDRGSKRSTVTAASIKRRLGIPV